MCVSSAYIVGMLNERQKERKKAKDRSLWHTTFKSGEVRDNR